ARLRARRPGGGSAGRRLLAGPARRRRRRCSLHAANWSVGDAGVVGHREMRHIVVLVVIALAACKHSGAHANEEAVPQDSGAIDPAEQAAAYDMQCVGGNLESCRLLATMYLEGKGVLQDLRRATQMLAQACMGANMP